VPDLIGTATAALDVVRRLREINKKVANAEFASALADLTLELGTPPIFLTPSLGVMMISEVSDGKANIYSGVQARGS
jgi:hypothetical protein